MNQKSQGESVCLIIDINSNFLVPLGTHINSLLQSIRTALGLLYLQSTHNNLMIFLIDTYDTESYQVYPVNQSQDRINTFSYAQEFTEVLTAFKSVIQNKQKDITHQSKLTKCLSKIFCILNKQTTNQKRIGFIASPMFAMGMIQFTEFLQLATHAGKSGIRFDLLQVRLEDNLTQGLEGVKISDDGEARSLAKLDALKLGVQLTSGIDHVVDVKSRFGIVTALILGVLNPGEQNGFSQPKITELTYKGFCACCNKLTSQLTKACSHCLAIHCDNKPTTNCVSCNCHFSNL